MKLNKRYEEMLKLHKGGMTKADIARKYGVTPQRIGQIFAVITNKLKKHESNRTANKI